MATNHRYDEAFLNTLEKWLSAKHNSGQQLGTDGLFETVGALTGLDAAQATAWSPSALKGGVLRGLGTTAPGGMIVRVAKGIAFVEDNTAGWLATGRSLVRPIFVEAASDLVVPAADPVNPRIDRVLAKPALYDADIELAEVKDPVTGQYLPPQNLKQRLRRLLRAGTYAQFVAGTADLCIKTGTPAGVPAAPAVDAGAVSLAQIAVGAAAIAIAPGNLTDERRSAWATRQRKPSLRFRVNGTVGGVFSIADCFEIVGEDDAVLTAASRPVAGRFVFTHTGLGAVGVATHVQCTPIGMGPADTKFTVAVLTSGGASTTVETTDHSGPPVGVNKDFMIEIKPGEALFTNVLD